MPGSGAQTIWVYDLHSDVVDLHRSSSAPKELKVYKSKAHAQALFNSDLKDEVANLIIEFMMK